MITSPNVALKTRSWIPLTARVWRMRKSCRWNSSLAIGFSTSVSIAVAAVTTSAASTIGRNSRRTLTPAALKAMISRSPARLAATRTRTGGAPDRLERFRELASSRLALGDLDANPAEAYRDIYALLDDEIVESLASGGVFASSEFLQDRLDAFGDAWGYAQFRLTRLGPLVVGAFRLSDVGGGNSVRVYGPLRDEAA